MAANLSVYNLGQLGVNVDKDPIHLEDGELTSAQNAIKDPLGVVGGITKRLGLTKFNSVAGAGSIAGGIGVPLLKVSTRTIYVGREDNSGLGTGWLTNTAAFTAASSAVTTPQAPVEWAKTFAFADLGSKPITPGMAGVPYNNTIIYAGNTYTQGTNSLPIRMYDGSVDKEIARITTNPDVGVPSQAVMSMLNVNGTIYITTYDAGTTSADFKGRVLQLNPNTGAITPFGSTFPTGYLPYSLGWHAGALWCGTVAQDPLFVGRVYRFRPGVDTAWSLDFSTAAGIGDIATLCSFNGELYAGTTAKSGSNALVKKRDSLGTWTTVDTGAQTGANNAYNGSIVFGTSLYIIYNNLNGGSPVTNVRKYDGSSWSTAYTYSSSSQPLTWMFSDNGILFALSPGHASGSAIQKIVSTPDGTTWTDRSANGSGATIPAYGIIYS